MLAPGQASEKARPRPPRKTSPASVWLTDTTSNLFARRWQECPNERWRATRTDRATSARVLVTWLTTWTDSVVDKIDQRRKVLRDWYLAT